MTGSKRWPTTAWRKLLELALTALDEVDPHIAWAFGGGTALALKLDHRISYDVDLFLSDTEILRALSPNRNSAARAISDNWQEPGNYIKLEREEGEIDFIVASRVTDLDPWQYQFKGRMIEVESPTEILAKKLKYRGSTYQPRDIFDTLAISRYDIHAVEEAVRATPDGAKRAVDRIKRQANRYRATIQDEVNPTSRGSELLEADPSEVVNSLQQFL